MLHTWAIQMFKRRVESLMCENGIPGVNVL